MVVEMLPPNQVASGAPGQDIGEIHPSISSPVSELSQPLRVTITFAGDNKTSLSSIRVCTRFIILFDW